jgi:hypothetical protein
MLDVPIYLLAVEVLSFAIIHGFRGVKPPVPVSHRWTIAGLEPPDVKVQGYSRSMPSLRYLDLSDLNFFAFPC